MDNNKVIALTFILGGALATAGGFFAGAQYGVINFHMGTVVGFKALTAALLGGIGSAPGALSAVTRSIPVGMTRFPDPVT